jgi:isochorismate hydrolase
MLKEEYFTEENIDSVSRIMTEELGRMKLVRQHRLEPEKAAMLIVDMQRYFLEPSSHAFVPSAPVITERLARLAGLFTTGGMPVFLTRHLNDRGRPGMMGKWWSEVIAGDNELSGICAELEGCGEVVVKERYDAFSGTVLERELRKRKIGQVVITGVMTHICCAATALSAFARGFEVFFPADGTATFNRLFHEAALLNLSHSCAYVTGTAEVAEELGSYMKV